MLSINVFRVITLSDHNEVINMHGITSTFRIENGSVIVLFMCEMICIYLRVDVSPKVVNVICDYLTRYNSVKQYLL